MPDNSNILDFADLEPPTHPNDMAFMLEEVDVILSDVLPMEFAIGTEGSTPPPPEVPSNSISIFPATPVKQRSHRKPRVLNWDPVKALSEDISPSKGSVRRLPKKTAALEPIPEADVFLGGNTSNATKSTKPSQSRSTSSSQVQSQSSTPSTQNQGPFLMFLKTASKLLSQYLTYDVRTATVKPVVKRLGSDGLPNITVSMAEYHHVHCITLCRLKIGHYWKTSSRRSTKHFNIVPHFCSLWML